MIRRLMRSATVARVHSLPRYLADLINCAGLAVPAGVRATTAKSANFIHPKLNITESDD